MRIPSSLSDDLDWWEQNILTKSNETRQKKFQLEIFSDASGSGWGAACNGEVIFGNWSMEEAKNHINYLELRAAFFGLQYFGKDKQNYELLLRIDNSTAVSYVNRMGGIQLPKLNQVTKKIWQFCEQLNLWVFASYYKENIDADGASRSDNIDTEWELAPWAFNIIINKFGDIEIDLFASKFNKKKSVHYLWHPDSNAYCTYAFTICWRELKFFEFPPVALILRTIQKIKNDQAQGILVAPHWPSQPWFPLWSAMALGEPVIFKPNENLLLSVSMQKDSTSSHLEDATNGRDTIRKAYEGQGFDNKAIDLVIHSLSEATLKQYCKPLVKWAAWCRDKNCDMYNPKTDIVVA